MNAVINILSFVAANATRSANSLLKGFFAKIVDAWASISVMMYGADDALETPSTSSLKLVIVNLRFRAARLRKRNNEIFTGASSGAKTSSSCEMPWLVCSKTL